MLSRPRYRPPTPVLVDSEVRVYDSTKVNCERFDFHFTSYSESWVEEFRGRGRGAEAGSRVKTVERRVGRAGEIILKKKSEGERRMIPTFLLLAF